MAAEEANSLRDIMDKAYTRHANGDKKKGSTSSKPSLKRQKLNEVINFF